MKITKARLSEIIKQELEALESYLDEEDELMEANPYHDPKTGYFSDKNKGNTYSFTKTADVRDELKGRGKYKGHKDDGTPKISSRFGANKGREQCGRKDFSSNDEHEPRFHCGDYKKPYIREDALRLEKEVGTDEYIKSLVKKEVETQLIQLKRSLKSSTCRPSLEDFIRFQALLAQAQNPPKK